MIDRKQITRALSRALSARDFAIAAWEGGAAAFGAVDDLSDIDLVVVVTDDGVDHCFDAVERALVELAPIECKWRLREPIWHGHAQALYRLAKTNPLLLIDLVVMRESDKQRFRDPARHGDAKVWFERRDVTSDAELEYPDLEATLKARGRALANRVDLLSAFVDKALARGHLAEAVDVYRRVTLAAVVELARIKHCPARFDFGLRYLQRDLPKSLADVITELAFVADKSDLLEKNDLARQHFYKLLEEPAAAPEPDDVPAGLSSDVMQLIRDFVGGDPSKPRPAAPPRIRDTLQNAPRTLVIPSPAPGEEPLASVEISLESEQVTLPAVEIGLDSTDLTLDEAPQGISDLSSADIGLPGDDD